MAIEKDQRQRLIQLVEEAITKDEELRLKYQVGEKFRFVRDRLQAILDRLKKDFALMEQEQQQKGQPISAEDETTVYVYLFNAHGLTLRSWLRMLGPKVFQEYSVNRPIYLEKAYVEAVIKNKPQKAHHGYLAVVIKKKDILQAEGSKDGLGNPVAKIKEGSLRFEKLITFTHNEHVYTMDADGALVKQE